MTKEQLACAAAAIAVPGDPVGPIEMGGMFTVVKVREGLARDDYRDPGRYQHPAGTVAYEWTGAPRPVARTSPPATDPNAMTVKKGGSHAHR